MEACFISFLAKVTHRTPPSVTAVKMPLVQSHLSPQDVALAFRAIISFHPRQILVLEPVGDFFMGPFSLLREAVERGELQGVPIHFMASENFSSQKNKVTANVHLISLDDLLLRREERERGSILPELDTLFTGQTVLLGGPQVAERASLFLNQSEQKLMLPGGLEFVFLLLLFLLMMKCVQFSWIDFWLILVGIFFCFVIIGAWIFQARNILFPWIALSVLLLIFLISKLLSCTAKTKK
ncbi:MAG: hypothetical protein FJ390_02770 [Verrucomicrobia bacterium]|nr:hypothetical protein [Verrucomicrobiota bacterium]